MFENGDCAGGRDPYGDLARGCDRRGSVPLLGRHRPIRGGEGVATREPWVKRGVGGGDELDNVGRVGSFRGNVL